LIGHLDHIQLAMPPGEEAAVREFCVDVLGLEEIAKPESLSGRGGAWFKIPDGGELHYGVEDDFTPAKKAHPAFTTARLDDLANHLAESNHPVVWDDALLPRRRFYTADPFGNRIEFLEAI
jgi:catechol 2,3-dioxygenase-like lactoylglutathione lyase family enzyme